MSSLVVSTLEQCSSVSAGLVDAIAARAIEVKDGSVTWIDPQTLGRAGRSPKRLDFHVFNGISGIALFLAASSRYLQRDDRARDLALRSLMPLRRQIRQWVSDPERAQKVQMSLGGVIGLGSYIYAFARIGDWLEEPELLADARALARLVTPERVASDRGLDVYSGSAGALLALLALDDVSGDSSEPTGSGPTVLETAVSCGEHLVAEHQEGADGSDGWRANGRPAWCGWAHGVAGIACALARLAQRTGRSDFLDVAMGSLEFERRHFDEETQNWLDLRSEERHFTTALCNGAPGIALGRLGMLDATEGDRRILDEIKRGLSTTAGAERLELDFVCCGSMGRAEILWHAGPHGFPDAREMGLRLTRHVAESAEARSGRFAWFESPRDEVFSPSFYTGAAGVGYTFLRMAVDEPTPCVLAME